MIKNPKVCVWLITLLLIWMRFIAQDLYMRKHYNNENKYFYKDFYHSVILSFFVSIMCILVIM